MSVTDLKEIVVPRLSLTLAIASLLSVTTVAQAQRPPQRFAIGAVAGATQYDLSGTGTTAVVGLRAEHQLQRWLVGEVALGLFRITPQFGGSSLTYTIPEAQLQLQLPLGIVRPYLGAGGGWVLVRGGETGTASGAIGTRVLVPGTGLDTRAELRVRGIGSSFSGATAEWTVGLAYRFPRRTP